MPVLHMEGYVVAKGSSWLLSWLGTLFRALSVPNICSEHCLRTTPRTTRITSRTIRTIHVRSPPKGGLLIGRILMVLEVVLVVLEVILVVLEVVLQLLLLQLLLLQLLLLMGSVLEVVLVVLEVVLVVLEVVLVVLGVVLVVIMQAPKLNYVRFTMA